MDLKTNAYRVLTNLRGWTTNRKIVVIESDDWGSIRMPSFDVYQRCSSEGYPVHLNPYERCDSLMSENDLTMLFEVLSGNKDQQGNNPAITANCVVANPDFRKIENDNFETYHYELITDTFKKYPKHECCWDIWQNGINEQLFYPQYHAREHLNVSLFMNALRARNADVLWGFGNGMPGSIRKGLKRTGNIFVEATRYSDESDKSEKLNIYLEGLDIFEQLFGYKSRSVIPPNYIWHREFDKFISEKGVDYIQGTRKMKVPENNETYARYLGQMNSFGQINLVRNCYFEPTLNGQKDAVDNCLHDIQIAFLMKKPAIISCHRVNFVGYIHEANRDENLLRFNRLLKLMLKKWPDIEFMTSVELGKLIAEK